MCRTPATNLFRGALSIVALVLAAAAFPAWSNHYILCGDISKCELPPPSGSSSDPASKLRLYGLTRVALPDGKTLVGGMMQHDATPSYARFGYFLAVQRLNGDGSPDLTFNGTGLAQIPVWGYYEGVSALAVQPDGKIVAGGFAADPIGDDDPNCYPAFCKVYPVLVRLNPDGTLDSAFNHSGRLILELGDANRIDDVEVFAAVLELALQSDGSLIVRSNGPGDASRTNPDGTTTFLHLTDVAHVNADGTLDTSYIGRAKRAREIPYFVPPATLNFQGLWWSAAPMYESGWGINLVHQADTIFATWFTYDATGRAWWLSMTARQATATSAPTYIGDVIETRGPPLGATSASGDAVQRTVVGTARISFAGLDWGTFSSAVNGVSQVKAISRMVFGPVPTCEYVTAPTIASTTNFQNLWWAANRDDDGWGINVTQQGNTVFATWFAYDVDGAPLWLSTTMASEGPGRYRGTLVRTSGPAFGATPFDPASVTRRDVGTATLTFTSSSSGNFAYTIDGISGNKSIVAASFVPPATTLCR